jgi:hypothetical protein
LFFFGFAPTKVAKTIKQTFLPTLKKGKTMRKKNTIKGKEKKGELKLHFYQSLTMVPTCAKSNQKKKKTQAPLLLRPNDGTISTQKQQNRRTKTKKEGAQAPPMLKFCWHPPTPKATKKRGEPKLLVCQFLVMVSNCAHKQPKKGGDPNCAKTW